jgi:hypothetical protein
MRTNPVHISTSPLALQVLQSAGRALQQGAIENGSNGTGAVRQAFAPLKVVPPVFPAANDPLAPMRLRVSFGSTHLFAMI